MCAATDLQNQQSCCCRRRKEAQQAVTHIGVQLPHKAGKVVVLEVPRQQVLAKLWWLPDNEAARAKQVGRYESGHHAPSRALRRRVCKTRQHRPPHLRPSGAHDTIESVLLSSTRSYLQHSPHRSSSVGCGSAAAAALAMQRLQQLQPLRFCQERWGLVGTTFTRSCRTPGTRCAASCHAVDARRAVTDSLASGPSRAGQGCAGFFCYNWGGNSNRLKLRQGSRGQALGWPEVAGQRGRAVQGG